MTTSGRPLGVLGVLAVSAALLTGCAAAGADIASGPGPTKTSAMRTAGRQMSGMQMKPGMKMQSGMEPGMKMVGAAPSAAAKMICSSETRRNVRRTLALDSTPSTVTSWADRVFTCTYRLPAGNLVLSVQDAASVISGRAYFSALGKRLANARRLHGMAALGLPALQTGTGIVAFLKDGKTLQVNATGLHGNLGVGGQSRSAIAYAVAADVVACWSE